LGACTRLSPENEVAELSLGKLFMQAIATSIDALAVGVTLQTLAMSEAGLALGVWGSTGMIGIVTFALSVGAVYVGRVLGDRLTDKAAILGGGVLLCIGIKILLGSF
jgi:putative Mn2+ efflux pump MntP